MSTPMHITVADVQTWLEPVKASISSLDPTMEQQISGLILGLLADGFGDAQTGVPVWVDFNTTPLLVRQAISMLYAAWYYDRQYSEVASTQPHGQYGTPYGALLRSSVDTLILGLRVGNILLVEVPSGSTEGSPGFYPTDISSTDDARRNNTDRDDLSLGRVMFGVSKVF